jgi:anaerobic nitric oxide reductase flavorubredoxin
LSRTRKKPHASHASYILAFLWTNKGVMVGAPTYEGTLFPLVAQVLDIAVHKGVRNKKAGRFGSYGWSGGAQRHFERIVESAKWDLFGSLEFMGGPTTEDLKRGEEFGAKFTEAMGDE